jgi:hemerythrin-like domain-containing protein
MSLGTGMYREQHARLLALGRVLESQLDQDVLTKDGSAARLAVSRIAGALQIHLAMEDESLYPSLLAHPDAQLRDRARLLREELRGLKEALARYLNRWPTHVAIERDAPVFAEQTRELLAQLARRIELEDRELFPLAEALP